MEIQQGDERASYSDAVLEKLSEKLANEFGNGFSVINLLGELCLRYIQIINQLVTNQKQ